MYDYKDQDTQIFDDDGYILIRKIWIYQKKLYVKG
jgi:hypothetical protein